jgi:hypothetical protein
VEIQRHRRLAPVADLVVRREAMLPATQFLEYWGLAFVTLCAALVLCSVFFGLIDTELGLDSWRREASIAVVASLVQGAGFWFAASLIPGGVRKQVIPAMIVAIIYSLTHLKDWSGYEIGAILFFQMVIWNAGGFLFAGQLKIAAIILVAAGICLSLIAAVAKSL